MRRNNKIVLGIFLVLLGLLTYMEAKGPESLNWSPSYSASDKIPLGTYVLFENLKDVFEVEAVTQPPYEFLTNHTPEGIYFFLNNQLLLDDSELEKLLKWVEEGNTVFLASDAFSKTLLDTLKLNTATAIPTEGISSKPMMNLVQPDLKAEEAYLFDHETYHSVFVEIDTLNQIVLGISQLYENNLEIRDAKINYIKAPFGKGNFFLNTSPQAFSNFFLLYEDNIEYVQRALGYLPAQQTLYWDAYYKTGKSFYTSPLYFLLSDRSLKWAYYLTILGCLLYILFEGKRKQRSIPVIKPLENQTYNFTRTISGLHLDRKDYNEITSKKISHFLDFIRKQHKIPTDKIDTAFFSDLAVQSENPVEEVRDLFKHIQELEQKQNIRKEELLKLNSAIQKFKHKEYGQRRNTAGGNGI